MTYQQTLDWMFAQLPMYQHKGKDALNAKLDTILSLSSYLGDPYKKFKSIHVAGTNGKGSSSHMLASILHEADYKVGLYTSPHLKDFRERIRINGQMISEEEVISFIGDNKYFLEANNLSFFEMTVGMAFDHFAKGKVDIAVVEVGLGGRLDSTNIICPEVALITNIGMDHMDLLGDSIEKITLEKAGIIKESVPVVISEWQEETAPLFKKAAQEKGAEITFASQVIKREYETSLLGNYQSKNIKGVVATLGLLTGFEIEEEHVTDGLAKVVENTGLLGRWQVLSRDPLVICDTAHNAEGLSLVLEQLGQQVYDKLHIVLGMVKDKNLEVILPLFPKEAHYYFCSPDIPRGLDAKKLYESAGYFDLKGSVYPSVENALKKARECATNTDLIFVGGSTFTVAEVV